MGRHKLQTRHFKMGATFGKYVGRHLVALKQWMWPLPESTPEMEVKVRQMFKDSPVVVFSKSYCPYCKRAKKALEPFDLQGNLKVYELDTMTNGADIQAALIAIHGVRTVPQVFIRGEYFGDATFTCKAAEDGALEARLRK